MVEPQKFQSWFQRNKFNRGFTTGALIALGAGMAFWNHHYQEEQFLKSLASRDSEYIKKIKLLRKKLLPGEIKKGELTMQTMYPIYQATIDITHTEFATSYLNSRAQKRKLIRTSNVEYGKEVERGIDELLDIVDSKLHLVLRDSQIPEDLYYKSCKNLSTTTPEFELLSLMVIEQCKIKLPSNCERTLTIQDARNWFNFFIEQYPQTGLEFKKNQTRIRLSMLHDLAAEKFGFEEEDVFRVPNLSQDHEAQESQRQIHALITNDSQNQ